MFDPDNVSEKTTRKESLIDDKDILQMDATVIAGILVLFTLVSILEPGKQTAFSIYVAAGIVIFALSATFLIVKSILNNPIPMLSSVAKVASIIGFLYLTGSVGFLVKW